MNTLIPILFYAASVVSILAQSQAVNINTQTPPTAGYVPTSTGTPSSGGSLVYAWAAPAASINIGTNAIGILSYASGTLTLVNPVNNVSGLAQYNGAGNLIAPSGNWALDYNGVFISDSGSIMTSGSGTITALTFRGPLVGNVTGTSSASSSTPWSGLFGTAPNLSVFSSTTSAQLATVLSDETGTGVVVYSSGASLTGSVTLNGSPLLTSAASGTLTLTGSATAVGSPTGTLVLTLNPVAAGTFSNFTAGSALTAITAGTATRAVASIATGNLVSMGSSGFADSGFPVINLGTVSSVAATVPSFLSVAGSPITHSGTLTITLSGTPLPVANGGTGATASTGTGSVVLSNSPALTGSATLNGSSLLATTNFWGIPNPNSIADIGGHYITQGPLFPMLGCSFSADNLTQLYFSRTTDGIHFEVSKQSGQGVGVSSNLGGATNVRDPSILWYKNKVWVAYTAGTFSAGLPYITLASGPDLNNLSIVTNISTSAVSGVTDSWCADWFIDDSGIPHILINVSTNNQTSFSIYYATPTDTTGLTTWGPVTQITGTSLPSDAIEGQITKIGTTYHLFFKDETTKYIVHATSSSPFSGYVMVGTGDWAGWGQFKEANFLINLGNGTYRMYMEAYMTTQEMYSDSSDGFVTWTAPANIVVSGGRFLLRNMSLLSVTNHSLSQMVDSHFSKENDFTQLVPDTVTGFEAQQICDNIKVSGNYSTISGPNYTLIDPTKSGWLIYMGHGANSFQILNAAPTGGQITFTIPFLMDGSTGNVAVAGSITQGGNAIANLASPTFTGTPAAPTATAGTNTTQLATTAFVTTATGSLITVQTGTLTSGTATKTVPAGSHPWVQDNASSLTNVGSLVVTVSGTIATITSTNILDVSPFTLYNAGSK